MNLRFARPHGKRRSIRKTGKPEPISTGCVSAASTSTGSPVMVPAKLILDPSGDRYTVMYIWYRESDYPDNKRLCHEVRCKRNRWVHPGHSRHRERQGPSLQDLQDNIDQHFRWTCHAQSSQCEWIANYDATVIKQSFPELNVDELVQPIGYIQLLVGSDNANLMPKEKSRKDKMIL